MNDEQSGQDTGVDLLVAGAGIVGVSTALWAAMRGLRVVLCDPDLPGHGASYGNACTIATYACLPVMDPTVLRGLPRLLTSAESPLSIDYRYAMTHPRWMLKFLANCRADRVRDIAGHLAGLLSQADAGLDPLLDECGARDLMVRNDVLYVWTTEAGARGARPGTALRRHLGVEVEEIGPDDVAALEPNLRLRAAAGLRFPGARHVRDPQALVARMAARLGALGGEWRQQGVVRVDPDDTGVTATLNDGTRLRAGRVAVTAGARSTDIAGTGAERLPLDVERGYHLTLPDHGDLLTRPVGWAEAGFYAVPMAHGLRLAGTVEIAGRHRPPNPRRLAYLRRKGEELLGPLPGPASDWMGLRPSFPDALPVIGPSPRSDRILLGFGHQHIGLTLGGITGRLLADMARGGGPNTDLSAFSATRFGA